MSTARDVMTSNILFLTDEMPISEAVQTFVENRITSAPVLKGEKDVLGQLTEMGLVRALVLHQLQPAKFNQIAHCGDLLGEATYVTETDPMAKVISTMIASSAKRVLVKGKDGSIVGIISPKDLLKALSGEASLAKSVRQEISKLAA